MIYNDSVYGKIEIKEPVLLEIINTKVFQRLKGIDQAGYRKLLEKPNIKINDLDHTRYDHSIGVYHILKTHDASLEEQIAGLIHDISHSAFSHTIDYVLSEGSEKAHNHQDNIHNDYVKNSEIAKIIKKHGFDLEYILNEKNFSLKEKNIPDLCADRIEYSLKTAAVFKEKNKNELKYILNNLMVENGNWIFKNYKSARQYAKLFLMLNTVYYSGLSSAYMFRVTGDCLKYALEKGYITKKDLYTTDKEVIDKIKNHLEDKKLSFFWDRLEGKISYTNNPKDYDAHVMVKSRVVNPLCKFKNKTQRVSEIYPTWKKIINDGLKPKEYFIKFVK